MRALTTPVYELGEIDEIAGKVNKKEPVLLSGCVDSQKLNFCYALFEHKGIKECNTRKIFVTFSDQRAKEIYEDCLLYDRETVLFPAKDLIFYQADIQGNQLLTQRMKCYRKLLEKSPFTLVTTFSAFMTPQIQLEMMRNACIQIRLNQTVDIQELSHKLVTIGYERTNQVENPGQFSVRGGILDLFDLTEENPFRIELWGDDVESIRSFDILSQRSIESIKEVVIYPAAEMILEEGQLLDGLKKMEADSKKLSKKFRDEFKTEEAARIDKSFHEIKEEILEYKSYFNLESYIHYFFPQTHTLVDYFDAQKDRLILDEPSRIKEHGSAVEFEFRESMVHRAEKGYVLPKQMDLLQSVQETAAGMERFSLVLLSTLFGKEELIRCEHHYDIMAKSISSFNNSFETLIKDLKRYKKAGYRVLLLSPSRTRARRIAEDLMENELSCFYGEDPSRLIEPGEIMTGYGFLRKGFEYPYLKFVVISESDIFGTEKKKRKKKKYEGSKISDFNELKVGDYVVHESHGLGIYKGIEKVEVEKVIKDYMKIEYRDGGNLYILATGFHVIQKYASGDAKPPKLNKLGTKEWSNTKTRVRSAVDVIAKDLVELYAIRQQKKGYSFGKDTVWQQEFEELFPYEETQDQILAIDATKADMEDSKIMDRLICGDVGYGKTEIAIRAAFKAVQEGKQVAYLVPTTILAQQHYNTFVQRMKNFPISIELLSRFRTPSQQKHGIEGLRKGYVDIVIGTHRILSQDVKYHDLGLLIVDEEQRFGVTDKEKIKKIKDDVDVLTLTATPIPRTLHMSLVGIRDMSVLEEPPQDRMPVQTYVMEFNEEMIREAILRELARDGQVYYVFNRVNQIEEIASMIQNMIPDATVAFAHGQMKESQLEKIMYHFIEGEIDVLVSTTIIETGLDIPNVNTIIIHDSDNFGLSQLYQLRGRVGRSNRNAYAFFLYKKDKLLKEIAEKRLQAIREFTELGSGFKIAMRDLEIRGAGNLLGNKQHGHMEAVGYDLYCKMLNEAVKNLKGLGNTEDFNTMVDLDVDAYIPNDYIMNEVQKLDIYKRIAGIETIPECTDMKEELMDRFGNIPGAVNNLLRIALIRMTAHKLFITDIQGKQEMIKINLKEDADLDINKIPIFLNLYADKMKFHKKPIPYFTCSYKKVQIVEKDAQILLTLVERILEDMKMLLNT